MTILGEITSDAVLDAAYEWLCGRRRDYSANADVWTFRCDWARQKQRIKNEIPQAASGSQRRIAAPLASVARRPTHCQQKSGRIAFNQWRLLHQFQQAPGLPGAS